MKAIDRLKVGAMYQTKISGAWARVLLVDKCEADNAGKIQSRDMSVRVQTFTGRILYRTPGQLRKASDT